MRPIMACTMPGVFNMRWSAALLTSALIMASPVLAKAAAGRPPGGKAGGGSPTPAVSLSGSPAGCGNISYSVIDAPDGQTVSILFDNFILSAAQGQTGALRKTCDQEVPLHLPPGYSLGVYQVDYRGFAHLQSGQTARLAVFHGLGHANRGHTFERALDGMFEGDYMYTETLHHGQAKRAGCGEDAVLGFLVTLSLEPGKGTGQAMMALDSIDGAPKGGLVFKLDLQKCAGH
jgi:hypothetical protein